MSQAAFGFEDGAPNHARLREHDADFTPQGIVRQGLLAARNLGHFPAGRPFNYVDPSSGAGVFGLEMRHVFAQWDVQSTGVELREEEGDWVAKNYQVPIVGLAFGSLLPTLKPGSFDLIATNPPFTLFPDFLTQSLPLLSDHGSLMMLGLSTWGQSAEGAKLFDEHPPHYQLRITGRIGFRGPGINPSTKKPWQTDQRDYSWWVWLRQGWSGFYDRLPGEWMSWNLPTLSTVHRTWRDKPGTVDVLGPLPPPQEQGAQTGAWIHRHGPKP